MSELINNLDASHDPYTFAWLVLMITVVTTLAIIGTAGGKIFFFFTM